MDSPSIRDKLKDLILRSLSVSYLSRSCKDGIQTGNHYQSITLDGIKTTGFRTDRREFLNQLDLEGKRVLDLGSNLGEISRAARERGAYLVDGLESDPYFIEIANLINAYSRVTRVSFYQRDITQPSAYGEHYDVVLAFSVFTYIQSVLPRIAEITDQLFVLETHKLEGNLESTYLKPVLQYFPHYKILGESEWGIPFDAAERRAIIVFAKEESALVAALKVPFVKQGSEAKSSIPAESALGSASNMSGRSIDIDVGRTCLQRRFFSHFEFSSVEDLFATVASLQVDLDAIARSRDSRIYQYSGWVYWLHYLKGYLQYVETQAISRSNIYFEYLMRYYLPSADDPGLSSKLSTHDAIIERIERRFRDFDFFRHHTAQDRSAAKTMAPVTLIVSNPPPDNARVVYEIGSDTPLMPRFIDGWHRLFAAKLCGIKTLRGQVVYEDSQVNHVRGAIEHFDWDGRRLAIRGWCLHPDREAQIVEVRVGGQKTARVGITDRPDVKNLFGKIPHANRSGFVVECECHVPTEKFICFTIVSLGDWISVGKMVVCYMPGMFNERNWPPAPLTQRLLGESVPKKLAFRSLKSLYEMLIPLQKHRSLNEFEAVLDWGVGCGFLQFFLAYFLPSARVTGIDVDREAVEWCRQSGLHGEFRVVGPLPPTNLQSDVFDLVLGYSILTRLTREAQLDWLAELHRVVKPGGYLAVTVNGELVRPFLTSIEILNELGSKGISDCIPHSTYQTKAYALQVYSKWFEVVTYIEGGVNDQQDLIIMRKTSYYKQLVCRIRELARSALPADATVIVASKGDDALIELGSRQGWHFPQDEEGVFAGHYPADSAEAIAHLEALRAKGGDFLLFPNTAFWWLEYYLDFRSHLDGRYRCILRDESCIIYQLSEP